MNEVTKIRGEQEVAPAQMKRAAAPQPEPAAVPEAESDAPKKSRKRLIVMLSVPLLILAVGAYFWLTGGRTVETDNAYVKQDVTAISTQVNGPVAAVYVDENQHVKRGDLLYRVDPAPFEAAVALLDRARASASWVSAFCTSLSASS